MSEIDEILDSVQDEAINPLQARRAIHSAVKEGIPKKVQGIDFHSGRQNSELSPYSPMDNQKIGYNRAISDMHTALDKLFEEGK